MDFRNVYEHCWGNWTYTDRHGLARTYMDGLDELIVQSVKWKGVGGR